MRGLGSKGLRCSKKCGLKSGGGGFPALHLAFRAYEL